MKASTVKFTIVHLHKPPFCGAHKYFIILLVGSVLYASYLPFNDYSTHSKFEEAIGFLNDQNCRREKMTYESTYGEICNNNTYTNMRFAVYKNICSTARTKIVKTQFVPRTVSLENYRVHQEIFTSTVKNLAFMCIADDWPILSSVYGMK